MGDSQSKMSVASTPKVEPSQRPKAARVSSLADPRSPSCAIDRTPIQVSVASSPLPVAEHDGNALADPRSPTPGVTRTPMKMSVTSLARRLSTLFLTEIKSGVPPVSPLPPVVFSKHPSLPRVEPHKPDDPREPLLKPQISGNETAVPTAVPTSPSEGYGSICGSPFVLIGEVEEEVDASLEEGEEALLSASPLRKDFSQSMLGCFEGVYASSLEERPLTPLPPAERRADEEHSYAVFTIPQATGSSPVKEGAPSIEEVQSQTPEVQKTLPAPEQSCEQEEEIKPVTPQQTAASTTTLESVSVEPGQTSIPCLRFDPRSPSQAIFKPQWLGVGFGTSGVRARRVQGRLKSDVPSPLASKRTATNENNNMVVRSKQRPREKVLVGEGRSPLQVLREANSPRERNKQKSLKLSTPDKQRFSQVDRRALILSLNKENK